MSGCSRSMVLSGLLATVGACKDDAAAPAADAAEAAVDEGGAASAAPAEAVAPGAEAAEPAKPPEPPPSGHAVAKVGALLFLSSTGEVGFELPPLGEGSEASPGMTVNVVGEQDGRLVVETLAAEPAEHHCAATLAGLSDFRLRLYLAADDLLPVLTEDFVHEHGDGTKVRLTRGVPVPAGSTELLVRGAAVQVPAVPSERLGRFYEPGAALGTDDRKGEVSPLDGHPLTVGGRSLDEGKLFHRDDALVHFGSTPAAGGGALVAVRNPCVEITALASQDRMDAAPVPLSGGLYAITPHDRESGILGLMKKDAEGGFLASPYGGAFADTEDHEDVWGGLVGSEAGEAYGVGGLGLVGTGRAATPTYEVKAGAAIVWADGSPAGQVVTDHRFVTEPRDEGGRTCFDAGLVDAKGPTVTLCFAPGDVSKQEPPTVGGLGLIGTGGSVGSGTGFGTGGGFGGSGKKIPTVRHSKPAVTGSLDKDIIRRIVRSHINEVRHCYNQGLVKDPTLAGKVEVQFVIGPSGSVSTSTIASSTLSDGKVDKCIAKAVKRWKFPSPTGGGMVVVKYPFVLEPG